MRIITLIAFLILLNSGRATGQESLFVEQLNLEKGIALNGYDPVSYFNGLPLKGSEEISLTYQAVVYYFATPENLEMFKASPLEFIPQYGGWCAYAMGVNGKKVKVNPKTFKIIDGKLYLFYNSFPNNTLKKWNRDEEKLKQKADDHWKQIIN